MKRLIYILAIGVLLSACSAQKRLNRLLATHPELQRVDTVVLTKEIIVIDTLILTSDTNSVQLTLQDILRMDSMANKNVKEDIQVETEHSSSSLQALGDGQFQLNAITKPDTIILFDTIYKDVPLPVPVYLTKTEIKEVPVYKLKWYQETLCWIGGLVLIITAILLAIKLALRR